jgi:16S rRNA (cytosine967-C5)-methyltransferase
LTLRQPWSGLAGVWFMRGQIDAFLARDPGWRVEPVELEAGRAWGAGRLLTPAHDGTDGFFMAAMVKS